ncbi:MAG: NERD domain-containing protein [Ruminococcaceae bacterium]|nr:NERD domain-containing protein [Oscillospiraceae bacterium]
MAIIHHGQNSLQEKIRLLEEKARIELKYKKEQVFHHNIRVLIKYLIIGGVITIISLIISTDHILLLFTDLDYLYDHVPQSERKRYAIIMFPLFLICRCIPIFGFWKFIFSRAIPIAAAIYVIISIFDKREYYPGDNSEYMHKDEIDILKAGMEGEESALTIFKVLPDTYHIFTNCELSYGEKHSETDIIVVGPTGVFIVEVKNHKGIIVGNASDKNLLQFKHSSDYNNYIIYGNTRVAKEFYNPVKQIGTHIWCLSNILQDRHIRTWVSGCVLFINNEANMQISDRSDSNIPIYGADEIDKMRNHICSQGTHLLSSDDIKNIVSILSA